MVTCSPILKKYLNSRFYKMNKLDNTMIQKNSKWFKWIVFKQLIIFSISVYPFLKNFKNKKFIWNTKYNVNTI